MMSVKGKPIETKIPPIIGENGKRRKGNVIYQNGKLYSKNFDKSLIKYIWQVVPESELESSTLYQKELWKLNFYSLALPDELAIFFWNDRFHDNSTGCTPYFKESTTREYFGKIYECDQYVIDTKSMAGTLLSQTIYNMLYESGNLKFAQKCFMKVDGTELLLSTIKIDLITSQVPENAFNLGKKATKVYAAKNGDMADLIDRRVVVEVIGADKKK